MKLAFLLHFHPSEDWWSHTRFEGAVGKVLAQNGDEVVFFYPRKAEDREGSWNGIRTVPVDLRGLRKGSRYESFELPRRVAPLLEPGTDAVLCTADLGARALFRRARGLRTLSLDWFQGNAPSFLSFGRPKSARDRLGLRMEKLVLPWLEGRHARAADVVVACSQMNRRDLQRLYRVPDDRIEVLPNGFDPVPPVTEGERKLARESLGLKDGTLYASFVGVDAYRKGLDVLEEAVRRVRAKGVPWRILNVGNAKRDTPEEVGYGFKDGAEKRAILAASDAFVFPTRFEGSPLPIPEAASMGLPFVTTPDASIDLGVPGKDYLQVPTGDAGALAEALAQLAQDPVERAAMAQRGHDAFAKWTWEEQAKALRGIIVKHRQRLGAQP